MIDLAITVTQDQEWQIITLKGELDDYQSRNLNQTFNKLIEETGSIYIILDLDQVMFIDSVGLGTIAIAGKKLSEQNGSLNLVCSQLRISKMIEMSGIIGATNSTIQLFDNIDRAKIVHA